MYLAVLGFRVQSLGFRVKGLGSIGARVPDSPLRRTGAARAGQVPHTRMHSRVDLHCVPALALLSLVGQ